jgi:hypothetical protein
MKTLIILALFFSTPKKSVTCVDQNGKVIAHKCSLTEAEVKTFIKSSKPAGPVTDQSPMYIFKIENACKKS